MIAVQAAVVRIDCNYSCITIGRKGWILSHIGQVWAILYIKVFRNVGK